MQGGRSGPERSGNTRNTRNLLFITADQWRGECLSALGHLVRTPNLDALAADGTLFTRHFANTAPCGPSRASIHTGMYQQNHRVVANGAPLDARHGNWALSARQAGYAPALFGYTDTTRDPRYAAVDEAWDGVLPGLDPVAQLGKSIWAPDAWAAWLKAKGYPVPAVPIELYTAAAPQPSGRSDMPPPLAVPAELHDSWFLVDQVLDYIAGRRGWCVHLSLLRPHPPWLAPAPYNGLYPAGELPPPRRAVTADEEARRHPYLAFALAQKHGRAPADDGRLRRWQAGYFGLMTEVDSNLGRLFEALQASGAWHDTLIVFTSDHGEQMGDHWLVGKLGYFDESFAVPLIVRNPLPAADAHRGRRHAAFTESVDLVPTMLDWLGVEAPPQCDGASLLAATETGRLPQPWRSEVHWQYDFSHGEAPKALGLPPRQCKLDVVRGENFKYVHFPNVEALPPVYFDLAADPGETVDLGRDPQRRGDVLEAVEKLLSWRMANDERGPARSLVTAGSYAEYAEHRREKRQSADG